MTAKQPVDLDFLERVHDAQARLLIDRRQQIGEIKNLKRRLTEVKAEREKWKDYAGRLHEKCMTLEAIPDGVLDAWDEQYLMDHDSVIYFKKLPGGRRRVVLERRGYGRLVSNGKQGDKFLRKLIEEASGRTRTSPQQQAEATPAG